jgi:hypothetical protein
LLLLLMLLLLHLFERLKLSHPLSFCLLSRKCFSHCFDRKCKKIFAETYFSKKEHFFTFEKKTLDLFIWNSVNTLRAELEAIL